ncbi:Phospholipase abhd3, partial [Halocaridina rubra]
EVLTLKDGGILALDWYRKPKTSDDAVTVILPGLTGSSQSEYIKGFVNNLKNIENVAIVIFNHRGMGGVELKTTRAYCGANSDDFEEAIEHIHLFYPSSPILASGVSLGG